MAVSGPVEPHAGAIEACGGSFPASMQYEIRTSTPGMQRRGHAREAHVDQHLAVERPGSRAGGKARVHQQHPHPAWIAERKDAVLANMQVMSHMMMKHHQMLAQLNGQLDEAHGRC